MLFYVSLGCLLFVIFIFAFGDKLKSELVRGIGNSLAIPCLLFGFLGLLISSFVTFRISISNDPADLINVHTKIIAVSNVNSVKEKEYYYDCFQEESNGEFKEHSYYWDDVTLIYRKNVLPKIETIQYTGQAGNWKFSPFYKIKTIKSIVFIFLYKIQSFILVSSEVYHNPSIPDDLSIFKEGITMESLQFKEVLIVIVFITLLALIIKALIDFLQVPVSVFVSAVIVMLILFAFLIFLNLLSK